MKNKFMTFREVYYLFREAWFLYRKYAVCSLTDRELEQLLEDVEQIRIKYHTPFANEILVAVMNELSRIAKWKEKR